MFFEIQYMDGEREVVDSQRVLIYDLRDLIDRTLIERGVGCNLNYLINSLAKNKPIVILDDPLGFARTNSAETGERRVIHASNIKDIKTKKK